MSVAIGFTMSKNTKLGNGPALTLGELLEPWLQHSTRFDVKIGSCSLLQSKAGISSERILGKRSTP